MFLRQEDKLELDNIKLVNKNGNCFSSIKSPLVGMKNT